MNSTIESVDGAIRISGEMTVYAASQLKQPLLGAVANCQGDIQLDLSRVSEFDTAGLQLLLLARREALATGRSLKLSVTSKSVCDALTLCGALDVLMGTDNAGTCP